jgi:hypothetical protein
MLQFRGISRLLAIGLSLMILAQGIAVAQVVWVKSFDEALKQAAREKKTIILDVSASW